MKILFLYEKESGGETIAFENVFKELNIKKNVNVQRIRFNKQIELDIVPQIRYLFYSLRRLTKHLCKADQYDWILASSYNFATAIFLLKIRYGIKSKVAWYYHGNHIPYQTINRNTKFINKIIELLTKKFVFILHKIMINKVALIIVPSLFSKKVIAKKFGILESSKIVVVYNGVDLNKFFPIDNRSNIKKLFAINKSNKVISYVGRIDPDKGVMNLVLSVADLINNKKNKRLTLIIAYNKIVLGVEKVWLEDIVNVISKLNISNNVKLIENYNNINFIYNISDLVVLPTKCDNFPLIIPESVASGAIVLASNTGGIPEILKNIEKRLLLASISPFYLSKSISYFLKLSKKRIKKIKRSGSDEVVNRFTIHLTVDTILKSLNKL